jgi:hypothetical protein
MKIWKDNCSQETIKGMRMNSMAATKLAHAVIEQTVPVHVSKKEMLLQLFITLTSTAKPLKLVCFQKLKWR